MFQDLRTFRETVRIPILDTAIGLTIRHCEGLLNQLVLRRGPSSESSVQINQCPIHIRTSFSDSKDTGENKFGFR